MHHLQKKQRTAPTEQIILTFGNSDLLSPLDAGYLKINVRPYIPNPRRCCKCQRFGHTSQSRRGKATCAKCSPNDHLSENCKASLCCVSCQGDHPAYSRSCLFWSKEKEVIALITIKEKISCFEERKTLGLLPRRSFASVVQQRAAPRRPLEPTGSKVSGPVVPSPAPLAVAATATP